MKTLEQIQKKQDRIREISLRLAQEFQEAMKDPKKREKAEEYYRYLSNILQEELDRPFTI